MNEVFFPDGFFPEVEPPCQSFCTNPPFKAQALNSEPGSFRIVQRNQIVALEARSIGKLMVVAAGFSRRNPGIWVKCEVEDIPCWAIVDTGASTVLISRHMSSLVGKHVKPHPHRLLGPKRNVMPIEGKKRSRSFNWKAYKYG